MRGISGGVVAIALAVVAVVAVATCLLWGATQPWTANHFGHALAGPNAPDHITYGGLRSDDCSDTPARLTQAIDAGDGRWRIWSPRTLVAEAGRRDPALFGASHASDALANDPGAVGVSVGYAPLDLYVSADDGAHCLYERGGGP